jgi:hypothetical protein
MQLENHKAFHVAGDPGSHLWFCKFLTGHERFLNSIQIKAGDQLADEVIRNEGNVCLYQTPCNKGMNPWHNYILDWDSLLSNYMISTHTIIAAHELVSSSQTGSSLKTGQSSVCDSQSQVCD